MPSTACSSYRAQGSHLEEARLAVVEQSVLDGVQQQSHALCELPITKHDQGQRPPGSKCSQRQGAVLLCRKCLREPPTSLVKKSDLCAQALGRNSTTGPNRPAIYSVLKHPKDTDAWHGQLGAGQQFACFQTTQIPLSRVQAPKAHQL